MALPRRRSRARAARGPRAFVLAALLVAGGAAASASPPDEKPDAKALFLRDGDRVVFYGDSITEQRLYTSFVETYFVTRFPGLDLRFVNAGWGGDTVSGGAGGKVDHRLERDVIPARPTVVTCMLGMNDGRYRPFDEKTFTAFKDGYEHLVLKLRDGLPEARITLLEPSPFDDVTRPPSFEGGYNAVLLRYAAEVRKLGAKERCGVVDLNGPVVAALTKAHATDAKLAAKLIADRIHPGAAVHLLMAEALLRGWNAPALVSEVELDAVKKTAVRSDNTEVSGVDVAGVGSASVLSWTQTDRALPFPIDMHDPTVFLVARSSDLVEALDREVLRVTGLAAAGYALKIDGAPVASLTAAELGSGVNLATLKTPMLAQAAQVHALTVEKAQFHLTRWQHVSVALDKDKLEKLGDAVRALDAVEEELVARQRAAARPKPHRYQLVPSS